MDYIRRCLLFMPGDSMRKITKGSQTNVDTVIMDLEFGVILDRKDEGRQIVAQALSNLDFGHTERLIRLNPPSTSICFDDLDKTIEQHPEGYVISRVEISADIQKVDRYLSQAESDRSWLPNSICLLALIETPLGLINIREIAQSCSRLDTLIFGGESFASYIGAEHSKEGLEILFARSTVVTAAAAYSLHAIDGVFTNLNDSIGLEEESIFARRLGFTGKLAIHPNQVEIIQNVFTPYQTEIEQAKRLIETYEAHQKEGPSIFEFGGKVVDMPMVQSAKHILNRAQTARLSK
ncbi:MAG: hypothetical protein B6242_04505 [Anaerolineaceae bacterium 4572_78]|nr:MAG: hypothetical protein B6242_04505 [Anaerolineaceae bacterium 4572_78]